ncbi:MAG: glycoside hydrolase family 3 N-terminal domain-containing protein [Bacteroidota bacterium]
MAKMTLADKVGEMTQLNIDLISNGQIFNLDEPHQLNPKKLRKILVDLRVGSILNASGHAYTLEHWREIIGEIQRVAMEEKPTGIPVLYGIDAIHGANYTLGSTLFPHQITMAASWNPEIARTAARITAYEGRASWIPWNFAPVLDIGRDQRWPRLWETFGEDVLLASDMGEAFVQGTQGNNISNPERMASCMKHFLGYSGPTTGKDRTQALIPERTLQEYYIPTFQRAVDAGAATVMICSGEINGIPVHANEVILKTLLRDEMGFKGLAVTDWEDIGYLQSRHRVAKDFKDAIKIAINAGIDMAMVPLDTRFPVLLKELVEEGRVSISRIDEAVERILTLKYDLGLFDQPYHAKHDYSKFASEEHAQASFEAALECLTLLKNEDNVLPLSKDIKVLITGPTANNMNCLNGGWTRTWQGNHPKWDKEEEKQTILEAIQAKIGKHKVVYEEGTKFDEVVNLNAAAEAAKDVDAIILCLGEMSYTETPGDIADMNLPMAQIELARAVAASGKPVILVLAEGRPRIIREVEPLSNAIVQSYLSGNEGGRAIAETLFGDNNPSGKLPYTYPKSANYLFNYDYRGTDLAGPLGMSPQFEFGHGLSYTTFKYSDLKVNAKNFSMNMPLEISVTVKNTGNRSGKEVVQLYMTDKVASITPSVKRLRGYKKVELASGASQTVKFKIEAKDLAFIGQKNEWTTEAGEFEINIGGQTTTVTLTDK